MVDQSTTSSGHTPPLNVADQSQLVIDRIVYLASLASVWATIDPMMDALRTITAARQPGQTLSEHDQMVLADLEAKLKDYLINRDPVRKFTAESLARQLQAKVQRRVLGLMRSTWSIIIVLAISLLGGCFAFVVPSTVLTSFQRLLLVIPLTLFTLAFSTTWLYLSTLRSFKPAVRWVFVYFSLSTIFMAMAFAHLIAGQILGISSYAIDLRTHNVVLLMSGFGLMYFGLRHYAHLLGVTSPFASLRILGGVALAVAVIFLTLHRPASIGRTIDLILAAPLMLSILSGAVLALKIRRVVTAAYATSMTWLGAYMLGIAICAMLCLAILFFTGSLSIKVFDGLVIGSGIMPQLMLLYTGYSFKKEIAR